jgi:hypothetical protein
VVIGDRLRAVREAKNLSQDDIEERTGLLRCYISRVENGHTVPINSSMMARSRLNFQTCPREGRRPTSREGVRGRTRTYCSGFAAFSVALIKGTGTCCYPWSREWRTRRAATIRFCIGFSFEVRQPFVFHSVSNSVPPCLRY